MINTQDLVRDEIRKMIREELRIRVEYPTWTEPWIQLKIYLGNEVITEGQIHGDMFKHL